jgi:hypothetical protein
MSTDGSRFDNSTAGLPVVLQKGTRWVGLKVHMGHTRKPAVRSVLL